MLSFIFGHSILGVFLLPSPPHAIQLCMVKVEERISMACQSPSP